MTISRIISGGQTGADQAALNVAILMGIAHGGFLPKGRLTEDGPLPARYDLAELPTRSYPKRTEQNVLAADGTVIFSHGPLKGGSRLTRALARCHGKPSLHIDFDRIAPGPAALAVFDWAGRHAIGILNAAGSRQSEDLRIYDKTFTTVRGLLVLDLADQCRGLLETGPGSPRPGSLEQAVALLARDLPRKLKEAIAGMGPEPIESMATVLGRSIRLFCGLREDNCALLGDCRAVSGRPQMKPADAAILILDTLCRTLNPVCRPRGTRQP